MPKWAAILFAHERVRIEAVHCKHHDAVGQAKGVLTLKELLASILLEEGFMNDRTCEVIDHQVSNRLDLLLGVSGVVRNGFVLLVQVR